MHLLSIVLVVACGSPAPTVTNVPAAPEPVATAAVATVFSNSNGQPVCPVMGDVTTPEKATSSAVYQGVTYYFCCDACTEMFHEDPAKYANGAYLASEGLLQDPASCAH